MLNDPELLMLFAREKQEELRRMMQSAQRSPFGRKRSLLRRPPRTVVQPLELGSSQSVNPRRSPTG